MDVLPPLPHYSGSIAEISDKAEHSLSECHFRFGSENLVFGAAVAEPRWLCPLGVILVWRMSRPVSLLIGQFLRPLAVGCGQNVS